MSIPYKFEIAQPNDTEAIWTILQQAIERRRLDGSDQWQDGYPNPGVIEKDILDRHGYVLATGNKLIAYSAIMLNNEPAYDSIDGKWLTNGSDFLVLHRIAVENNYLGKGCAKQIFKEAEQLARQLHVPSIRVDTNFDNQPMLHILKSLEYIHCGEVVLRGGMRKAFEKILPSEK
jgi:GNAT superfamily N-acetyltransferase